jgi:hypothetical protein
MSNAGGPWPNRWMGTGRRRDSCNVTVPKPDDAFGVGTRPRTSREERPAFIPGIRAGDANRDEAWRASAQGRREALAPLFYTPIHTHQSGPPVFRAAPRTGHRKVPLLQLFSGAL